MGIEIDRSDEEPPVQEILNAEESPAIGSPAYEARKRAFFAELDARPVLDARDWREIEAELYDEHGQPIG